MLARQGMEVVLIDRDEFPSDTISTHLIYPNTLARLSELGILDRLLAAHTVPMLQFRLIGFGHESGGNFTPVDGFDTCAAPRRVALDSAIVETALAAGAKSRFGQKVVDLIGPGSTEDPVAGVVLENGEQIRAPWVFGADGRASTIAGKLGIEKERPVRGEVSYLLGYWRGLPNDGFATSDIKSDAILSRWAGEDDTTLITAWGDADFTKGSKPELRERYFETLRRFPNSVDFAELDRAEMFLELIVAPETLMRGYFRRPVGPGWALVGDACHFKHPGTAQGISDAIEQAIYIGEALAGRDPELAQYEAWRDARAAEHYEWSFSWGKFPPTDVLFKAWAAEPDVAKEVRDTFSRVKEPSQVLTRERLTRWFGGQPAGATA